MAVIFLSRRIKASAKYKVKVGLRSWVVRNLVGDKN